MYRRGNRPWKSSPLKVPGSLLGQQAGGCVQEGPEPALLPQEAQVLQCLQADAPDMYQAVVVNVIPPLWFAGAQASRRKTPAD